MPTPVALEVGRKRTFASALDWPGWCRSGADEARALTALAAAAARYAPVAALAGLIFPLEQQFEVVERLPGSATTDFGAPGTPAQREAGPLPPAEAGRLADLVAASWSVLERVVAGAPAELRKGPRGGGRDRDAIVDHVLGAEAAYARTLGLRLRQPAASDRAAVAAFHDAILEALRGATGQPAPGPGKRWPPRYFARRTAWHALDHAWEIEDRSA